VSYEILSSIIRKHEYTGRTNTLNIAFNTNPPPGFDYVVPTGKLELSDFERGNTAQNFRAFVGLLWSILSFFCPPRWKRACASVLELRSKPSVDVLVSFFLSKSCMSHSVQSLVSHVIDGLVGLPVLCLFGLPVMDVELFDRWVFLSITPLLQMMMMLQQLPHPQQPKQVGTLTALTTS